MGMNYYMGKRLEGSALRHTFKGMDGGVWYFTNAKDNRFFGCVIGRQYDLGEDNQIPRNWVDANTGVVHPDAAEWQARARTDLEYYKTKSKEVAPEIKEAIEALRSACRGMSSNDRSKFLAYLISQFMAWRL